MQGLPRENDGFWGEVPRGFVETELKLSLSMGEENIRNPNSKMKDSGRVHRATSQNMSFN